MHAVCRSQFYSLRKRKKWGNLIESESSADVQPSAFQSQTLLAKNFAVVESGFKPAAHERTCRAYLLFLTSWIDKISSCAGNIYGIFVIRDM
jgi:hypothetical protein